MTDTVIIEGRFHGPRGSGNGGYSCGLAARFIRGPAAVRLHVPPPLDTPMEAHHKNDRVELVHDGVVVATARPADVDIEVPKPPDFTAAKAASRRYRGFHSHFYPGCFVCGPEREPGDGLRVFAGPLDAGDSPPGAVAATWVPDETLTDGSGSVLAEYLWAVLDCPGAYSFPEPADGVILLGELAVSIHGTIAAGEKCVVIGWEISHEGRKHQTGTALFGENGGCRAVGRATWLEIRA